MLRLARGGVKAGRLWHHERPCVRVVMQRLTQHVGRGASGSHGLRDGHQAGSIVSVRAADMGGSVSRLQPTRSNRPAMRDAPGDLLDAM